MEKEGIVDQEVLSSSPLCISSSADGNSSRNEDFPINAGSSNVSYGGLEAEVSKAITLFARGDRAVLVSLVYGDTLESVTGLPSIAKEVNCNAFAAADLVILSGLFLAKRP